MVHPLLSLISLVVVPTELPWRSDPVRRPTPPHAAPPEWQCAVVGYFPPNPDPKGQALWPLQAAIYLVSTRRRFRPDAVVAKAVLEQAFGAKVPDFNRRHVLVRVGPKPAGWRNWLELPRVVEIKLARR